MAEKAVKPISSGVDEGREAAAPLGARERESDAQLREIVDHAIEGIVVIDDHGAITDFNPAAQRLFGYSAKEIIGKSVTLIMPEPDSGHHDAHLRRYRETGERRIIGITREVSARRKDGSTFSIELSVSEVLRGGRLLFTGIVRDISERKRIDAERQKYVSLVENNSDFMAMASLSWELLYINRAGCELVGITPEQVKGMEVRDFWDEETLPAVLKEALPVQVKGGSFRFHGKVKNFVTGEAIDVDCNTFGIVDQHTGETFAIGFSLRDMREQMRREQALRDSEARLQAILDSAVDGIVTINERGIMEGVNAAARKIFGYEPGELLGKNVNMLMPDPYAREHDQYLRNYRHTGQRKIIGIGREVIGRRKDGSVFPADLSVSEVRLDGRVLFAGIVRDITERKQVERHRALLVAELSHRVKNTLATVISIARQTFPRVEPFTQAIASFDGRVRALAHTHSRLAERSWIEGSLASVVEDEITPYRNPEGTNIVVEGPEVLLKSRNAISLGMALHELVTNAAKHGALSKVGGMVEIAWDCIRPGHLRIRWSEKGGPEVKPPERSGFGRLLLERGLAHELRGKVQLDFAREGLKCIIVFPLNGPAGQEGEGGDGI